VTVVANALGTCDWRPTLLLLTVVVPAAVCDVLTRRIFNAITYPGIVAGFALNGWLAGWAGVSDAGLGFAAGFGPLLVAYLIGGYGGGDAKLMGAVGAIGGAWTAVSVLMYALLLGVAMGLIETIWRGRMRATLWRTARAAWLVLAGGRPGDPVGPHSIQVRLGLAIALGSVWHLAEAHSGRTLWDWLVG